LAQAVATSMLAVTRLHVTCRYELRDACLALFGPLRDAVLTDLPRVRCAVLSVLRRYCCAVPGVAIIVLALAEGGVVRTITWDERENW
jgi:hypothetical protein